MKVDILIQNLFNLFIFALIVEIAIMGIFSMTAIKDFSESRPVAIARDVIVLALAVFLCYKYSQFNVLKQTGISLTKILNTVISALVLFGMTNLIKNFFSNVRKG
ncbi:hypothetical protein ACFL20_12130 [Spirochaetota bacterium]